MKIKRALSALVLCLTVALAPAVTAETGSPEASGAQKDDGVIGIISAMENEVRLLLSQAEIDHTDTIGGVDFYTGTLCGRNVVIAQAGVGKVLSAAGTSTMLSHYPVSSLIFTGIAGGVGDETHVLDIVIARELVQHDYGSQTQSGFEWVPSHSGTEGYYFCDEELVEAAYQAAAEIVGEEHVFRGLIATGDQFIASEAYVNYLQKEFGAIACEMEGAAVATVCEQYQVPFVIIRSMSDKADGKAYESIENMGDIAADRSGQIVMKILKKAGSGEETAFDPYTDPLLQDTAERSHTIHNDSLGYPGNEDIRLDGFYEWFLNSRVGHAMLNNAGDPNDVTEDHGTLRIENEVIRFFAPLYGFDPEDVWGLVTMSGTDGNNHGIYFGRHYLTAKTGMDPILYVSAEAHYSNMRLAELQQLEVRMIETDEMGRMIPEAFRDALDPERPALIVFSMGTTFKGAIDDQQAINAIVEEVNPPAVYRHVDAALFGGYLPFSSYSELVDRRVLEFDSIAVSGHKFFGMDEPCGLFFTSREIMKDQNPYQITYLNGSMPMINCSRSAINPLKFYWLIRQTGEEGFRAMADTMLENAAYLKQRLDEIGWPAWVSSEMSNTVFFARPSDAIMEKYILAPDHDDRFGGDLAHVVVMASVTKEHIDRLVEELQAELDAEEKPAA